MVMVIVMVVVVVMVIVMVIVIIKLEGVGPVDNRPSTDELHHFV